MNKNKAIIGALALIAVLVGVYFIYPRVTQTPEQKTEAKTADLMAKVSKHMLLPTGENPTIFEIKDPATLASQQVFFANAQQGDQLLVFSQAGKAVIYSPSRDIIVNVGPITNPATTTPKAKK
jgi:galactose mutarotase-like enzyme